MNWKLSIGLVFAACLAWTTANAGHHKSNTIVDVAQSAGQFNTLLAAVRAAGLAEALAGEGPLTVFAPTDEAFAALPEGTVANLLKPENKDQLVSILTYHVAPAKLKASDVIARSGIETLNGKQPAVAVDGSRVMIDGANIVSVDIQASNGIIHVIDKVLLPPRMQAASENTRRVIAMAISKGAPLYNNGHAGACADIYEVTAHGLLTMDDSLTPGQRRMLEDAMSKAARVHSDSKRAWLMREALDAVFEGAMTMPMSSS